MKNIVKLAFIAALTCLTLTVSQAQPKAGDWEFTIGGGGQTFDADFDEGAFNVSTEVGYFLNDNFEVAVRQGLGYTSNGGDWNGRTTVAGDWHFQLGKFVPFIGANAGYLYGTGNDVWGIGPEAGVKFYVHQQTFIFVRGDYLFTFDDADDADERFDDGSFGFTVGVGFNF